jgi:predicted amidohydrolase YtcJ
MAARLTTYVVVGIVAATLIAGLIVGAQRDDSDGPVDLIVFNASVYTADASGRMAEAVAVRGNQILRVGSNREINRLRRPQTIVVDALGGAVVPGFNDAEARLIDGGLALDTIDLLDAETPDEVNARIRTWAAANPDRPWVVGRGWDAEVFQNGGPTRQLLDAAVADRPAFIVSHDGRAAWVNTKGLRLAKINRRTPMPPDGLIVKDARTGEPTGVLKDGAVALVARLVPRPTREERVDALRTAVAEAHRHGITSVQEAAARAEEFTLYEEARRAGDLNLRVYSSVSLDGIPTDQVFAGLDALSSKYPDDPLFKVGGVKITLDGPVETFSAAMLEPYAGKLEEVSGESSIAPDDLNRMVRLLDARGWQVTTGAVGDRAVRMALDAYAHAVRSNPEPPRGRRHRIEHIGLVETSDLPRFRSLHVIASMLPLHGVPRDGRLDAWVRNVGVERAASAWPYGSIAAAGGKVEFGTGWPSAALNPMAAIHAAVNRAALDGTPAEGSSGSERLPLKRAIDAFTSVPAYASFDEQRKGSLKPGMLADLVVLSTDIFTAPADELAATTVAVTVFDGKIVYNTLSPKSTN